MTNDQAQRERRIAEAVRAACVRAALETYEQAASDGLCAEGAFEAAVDALRSLDLDALVRATQTPAPLTFTSPGESADGSRRARRAPG
jgi:hypothetical protein